MKELQIYYHNFSGRVLAKDGKKTFYIGNKLEEFVDYFNKNPEGIKIRDRGNLHLFIDLETLVDPVLKKSFVEKIQSIKWHKKTSIDYKKISGFHV